MTPPPRVDGFTLVELAIALVIIALFVGGIIIGGASVMDSAKTSNLLTQIKDLAAASREFKTRYGYYPGDMPNAATFITMDGGVSAACSYAVSATAGNGIVDTATESACALEHLVKARMLSKVDINSGNYIIPHPFGGGNVSLSALVATGENAVMVTTVPCKIALQIDSKLDNGAANPLGGGFVIGIDSSNTVIASCVPGGTSDPVAALLIRY